MATKPKTTTRPVTNAKKDTSRQQLLQLEDKYKRIVADYHNQHKRLLEKQEQIVRFANQQLIEKLLPVIDSLYIAQAHLKDSGLSMVINQLSQVLESEGISTISPDNQSFDPHLMDCVEVVPGTKDIVVSTLSLGYKYHDKVIRPAKVKVGSGDSKSDQ